MIRRDRDRSAIVTSTIPLTIATFHGELVRQLQQSGYAVTVVASPGPDLDRIATEFGVDVRPIAMAREIDPRADAVALRQWIAVCRQIRPQLVVAGTPKASLLAMVAARATGVPQRLYYLAGLRLEGEHGVRRGILAAMERVTGAAASVIVGNSPSLVARSRELALFDPAKLTGTRPGSGHGVDANHYSPRSRDDRLAEHLGLEPGIPVVGFVGRLTHDKGIDTLLAALEILRGRHVDVQLLVVGAQIEPDSETYAAKLRSASRVALAGNQRDVRPYYALMDLNILPSLREGFPNVVLESAAMGVPTIASDATGCVDAVVNGVTGLVVPVRDAEALADAIEALVTDPDRRAAMGRAARERAATDYAPERVVRSLLGPVLGSPAAFHTVTQYGSAGGSARVRVFDWLDYARRAGAPIDATRHTYRDASDNRIRTLRGDPVGTAMAEREIRALDTTGSTVLLSRGASPFSRGDLEERLLRRASRGVYDFDDALYADPSRLKRSAHLLDACERAVRAADVVIAGNEVLAGWAEQHARDVRIIPSCVEPDDYVVTPTWDIGSVPRLVWLGSASTEAYVAGIAGELLDLHRRTGARLRVISGPDDNPALAPLAPMLDRVPWTATGYAAALADADIAIAPLDDTDWSRGKCAYKLLQYAAAGLPMVASPVGANQVALQRFSGIAAEHRGDWVDAVTLLLGESASQRERRARQGLAAVREHYSFASWWGAWSAAVGHSR